MTARIAQNVYIDPTARVAADVHVGPNSWIGPNVTIGPGCKLHNNVTIYGPTTIGTGNEFYPNGVIGADPQDLKYKGGPTELHIGNHCVFREGVTANRGTELGGGRTVVGDKCLFMAYAHIGHDSIIEDHVIVANNVLIGGHVRIERCANIGGGAAIHHFATIGRSAMVGGLTRVVVDVPPFTLFEGNPGGPRGINVRGLTRSGLTEAQIEAVKDAFKKILRGGNFHAALAEYAARGGMDENVRYFIEFLQRRTQGKFGRYLETQRSDTPEDIRHFYHDKGAGK